MSTFLISTYFVTELVMAGVFFAGLLEKGYVKLILFPSGRPFLKGEKIVAHTITDDCTNCAACEDSCPVNSISEQGGKRAIDADTCIDCGACVDTCPVNAIHA
jgi:NAD-dependent dihydropyrimidine dehydrogenase PreA subunit